MLVVLVRKIWKSTQGENQMKLYYPKNGNNIMWSGGGVGGFTVNLTFHTPHSIHSPVILWSGLDNLISYTKPSLLCPLHTYYLKSIKSTGNTLKQEPEGIETWDKEI